MSKSIRLSKQNWAEEITVLPISELTKQKLRSAIHALKNGKKFLPISDEEFGKVTSEVLFVRFGEQSDNGYLLYQHKSLLCLREE